MPNQAASLWSRTYHNNQSYVVPIADELLELVNTSLSPYKEVFTLSDLDIMSVNSDGSISSSTGHVEDSQAARPPVRPSTSTEEDPEEETPTVDENGNPIDPETGLPVTGGETTDPGTGTTDPGTGGTTDPDTGTTDPGSGTTDPGTGTTDPGTGTTDPGTGTTNPDTGTTDPGTGTTSPDSGTTTSGTGTTDPGTSASGDSGTGGTGGGTDPSVTTPETPADPGFSVIDPAPAA